MPLYRRNSDSHLRSLERQWRATGDWNDKLHYNLACVRSGIIPPPDVEIELLWGGEDNPNYWSYLSQTQSLIKIGDLHKWFRRWYFPGGWGASVAYDSMNPLPGQAPGYRVPFEEHQLDTILFVYVDSTGAELSRASPEDFTRGSGSRRVVAWPIEGAPNVVFYSGSVERFPLTDDASLLRLLQEAAAGRYDDPPSA